MIASSQVTAGAIVAIVLVVASNVGTSSAALTNGRSALAAQMGMATLLRSETAVITEQLCNAARAAVGAIALPEAKGRR